MRALYPVGILAAAIALAGCGRETAAPAGPSWLLAEINGEFDVAYEGSGRFGIGRDHAESPYRWRIWSHGTGGETDDMSVSIRRNERARPRPGAYEVLPLTDPWGSDEGWSMTLSRQSGPRTSQDPNDPSIHETYVARSGTIEITASNKDVVEGTFSVTAVLIYRVAGQDVERNDDRVRPDPGAPTIQVTGTFRTVYWNESMIGVLDPDLPLLPCDGGC